MRLAVDAMGGDFAPAEIVAGTVVAARELSTVKTIYLVGDEAALEVELAKHGPTPPGIKICHASQVVGMEEKPAIAIRRKRDSSIGKAVELVKSGDADGLFSAGNTGAAVAATTLKLRTLEGVERPAIATVVPTRKLPAVLLDAGATTDCTSTMLVQFAIMGMAYSREILGRENPSVGLLSIGGEDAKGNETTRETFRLLSKTDINFCGNVESSDLFAGSVDVVVCDGFVGNVVLKTCESVASAVGHWFKEEIMSNPLHKLGALMMYGGLRRLKRKADPAAYGGAPLLGVNGVCIIGHGSSSARAVRNAIGVCENWVRHGLNQVISREIRQVDERL
jgi:glycerol-3-phosphate acyltransferase PlsX